MSKENANKLIKLQKKMKKEMLEATWDDLTTKKELILKKLLKKEMMIRARRALESSDWDVTRKELILKKLLKKERERIEAIKNHMATRSDWDYPRWNLEDCVSRPLTNWEIIDQIELEAAHLHSLDDIV